VKFDSRPPGAKILIAGRDTGLITPADVPVELSQLPARARFELAGFRAEETDLTSETVQNPVSVSLSPREVGPRGRLVGNGEYAFEVLDGRRVISASSERHDVAVSGVRSLPPGGSSPTAVRPGSAPSSRPSSRLRSSVNRGARTSRCRS